MFIPSAILELNYPCAFANLLRDTTGLIFAGAYHVKFSGSEVKLKAAVGDNCGKCLLFSPWFLLDVAILHNGEEGELSRSATASERYMAQNDQKSIATFVNKCY